MARPRPLCQHTGCRKIAQHNPAKKETKFCIEHGGGPRCQRDGCGKSALHDPAKMETKFCVTHGGGPRCSLADVHQFDDLPPFAPYKLENGDPACLFCTTNKEPWHEKVRTFVNREVLISTEVNARLPELAETAIRFTCDEALGGCSRKRPDMLWDFGTAVLWLEVNERQHETYAPQCEADRRNQIWQDIDNRPALLIEFNPDEYEDDGGKHQGMFYAKRTPGGEKKLRPNPEEFERRMGQLVQELGQALEDIRSIGLRDGTNDWDGIKQRFLFYTPSIESTFRLQR